MPARASKPSRRKRSRAKAAGAPQAAPLRGRKRHPLITLFIVLVWGLLIGTAGLAWIAAGLPDERVLSLPAKEARVRLLDRHGLVIASRGMRYGGDVDLGDLPPHVPLAFIAAEDRRFYVHEGVDLWGVLRAALINIGEGRVVQGGSTITQQLAKNLFLTPERTFVRKIQEVMLAFWLESRLSKDEILTLYLNRVYFGAGTYGIESAARRYFGKPPAHLTLGEGAMLAGLLKAPSRYAPTANRAGAEQRTDLVMGQMVREGFITDNERRRTDLAKIRILQTAASDAPYFTDWIVERLPSYAGKALDDVTVETSLDTVMQRAAEQSVRRGLLDVPDADAALVALAPDGAVRALVGGRSYRVSQFNRAVQARRQPGSAFKPFVYAAALKAGYTPQSRILDAPVRIGSWAPGNFKDRYMGDVSLTAALAYSLNGATVRLSEQVGRRQVIHMAQKLGLKADFAALPSLPLGTLEVSPLSLATAYVPFANGGEAMMVSPVHRILDRNQTVLYERGDPRLGRALDTRVHARIDQMLQAVVREGTGRAAQLKDYTARGKTGTSQNGRDAWFVGYTPDLITVVWVGRDDNRPLRDETGGEVTGGTIPARIWRDFMSAALTAEPPMTGPEPLTVRSLLLELRRQP